MKFTPQSIPDLILIEPKIHSDERGYLMETYRHDLFEKALDYKVNFIQDNESKSTTKGVLRGLHYQVHYPQAKLLRCLKGKVFDVAVDIRKDSPYYGKWVGKELSGDNKYQLYIPEGFAHGYYVMSETAEITYKCF